MQSDDHFCVSCFEVVETGDKGQRPVWRSDCQCFDLILCETCWCSWMKINDSTVIWKTFYRGEVICHKCDQVAFRSYRTCSNVLTSCLCFLLVSFIKIAIIFFSFAFVTILNIASFQQQTDILLLSTAIVDLSLVSSILRLIQAGQFFSIFSLTVMPSHQGLETMEEPLRFECESQSFKYDPV